MKTKTKTKHKTKVKHTFTVYSISINGLIRYIGRTSNLKVRTRQHRNACYNPNHKEYNKQFYQEFRKIYPEKRDIILTPIKTFNSKTDSKRYELYLILHNYFFEKDNLFQRIPNISDKFL